MTARTFETIHIEGGLLSGEYLQRIAACADAETQKPAHYRVPRGLALRDEILRAWKIARALRRAALPGRQFALQFLGEALGFDSPREYSPVYTADAAAPPPDDICRPTHITRDGVIPLVIAAADDGLDRRQEGLSPGRKISPFNLAQTWLNSSAHHLWGAACDGNTLRILRDSASMTRAAYIEADLARMLDDPGEEHYSDFVLLYLCAHASRFAGGENCPLEKWRRESVQTGLRAHEKLRLGVESALQQLGSGFLQHPANDALRAELSAQFDRTAAFYRELLWLVYRLIFLLVTEDRGLLHRPDAGEDEKAAYRGGYGISRLRDRAAAGGGGDDYADLWEGVKHAFEAMRSPKNRLGLPATGGLFERDRAGGLEQCALANRFLLAAVRDLSYFTDDRRRHRVNYRDMGSEELGSIYESLLELTPRATDAGEFKFIRPRDGGGAGARKTSGSYYTAPPLVEELLNSALQPKLQEAQSEDALLAMRVIDPACGSGHFLLAAARRMAERLARLRADDSGDVTPQARRRALRDVISRCICGVDKNAIALDLAKTALWLEAFDAQKPLVFLDHHLQCGDSLLGARDLSLLQGGVPDAAYDAAAGDDKKYCAQLKKSNARERKNKSRSLFAAAQADLSRLAAEIDAMPEDDLLDVEKKRKAHNELEKKRAAAGPRIAADMFTAAFLMPKTPQQPAPPTSADVFGALAGDAANDAMKQHVQECARAHGVFHWPLAFPAVFAAGGFAAVLANPPWERIKLQEQEFFANRDEKIAAAPTQAERRRLIAALGKDDNDKAGKILKQEFQRAKHAAECGSRFMRRSGVYPLSGRGDVNTYALFAELCAGLAATAGVIVPTGIATDLTTKDLFAHLVNNRRLKSLYDFENRNGLFPDVHRMFHFSLLTIADSEQAEFVVFAHELADARDERRRNVLTAEQLRLVNPNTVTMPLYRTGQDRALCEKMYRAAPVLWRDEDEETAEQNPWQLRFQRMVDMSNDSNLFHQQPDAGCARLYESKLMHQYDHRWATYQQSSVRDVTEPEKQDPDFTVTPRHWIKEHIMLARVAAIPPDLRRAVENGQQQDIWRIARDWLIGACRLTENDIKSFLPQLSPAYDVCRHLPADIEAAEQYAEQFALSLSEAEALQQAEEINGFLRLRSPGWLMGWRNITNAANALTVISSILPLAAAGHNILLMHSRLPADRRLILHVMLNSVAVNYAAKQKISGVNFNYSYMKQLPVLPPSAFSEADPQAIVPAALELTFTAHDLRPFYDDITRINPAYDARPPHERGRPYRWDDQRRASLRAELDARIALKYGLSRDELRYILDPADLMGADYPSETFRILKQREENRHGEYRTRRLTLAAYDALTAP